jgi:beta-aspartyl-peptidase (threonine type)
MTNKRFGRIGDSPIIGAGTWADNATCAVSATGVGEYIMRLVLAYDIAALIMYKGMDLKAAADEAVLKKLTALGGSGGVIAIDQSGTIAMPFNSPGMYRGYCYSGDDVVVRIFEEPT